LTAPVHVAGAAAATCKLAWWVVPSVVLPTRLIVPELLNPAAVTVVDALSRALPMARLAPPLLVNVPPTRAPFAR
jgi:hypothetical protein